MIKILFILHGHKFKNVRTPDWNLKSVIIELDRN